MLNIGLPQLLIFGAIILLLFGSRLPGVMRSLGSSITEFKKGVRDADDEVNSHNKA
jgi:sec-independent protein translocase protein TatA